MNLLTSPLPTKIKVNDNIYGVNYDYRVIINIIRAFEDETLTQEEKLLIMLKNLYKEEVLEEDIEAALKKAIKFIDLGKENNSKKSDNTRIYSFEKDGNYIFTGINSTHHIDIEKEKDLHWWKFMAMFMDMDTECMFSNITYYRKRKLEGKLTKEEKNNYEKIKDLIDLEPVKKQSESKKKFFEEFRNANK